MKSFLTALVILGGLLLGLKAMAMPTGDFLECESIELKGHKDQSTEFKVYHDFINIFEIAGGHSNLEIHPSKDSIDVRVLDKSGETYFSSRIEVDSETVPTFEFTFKAGRTRVAVMCKNKINKGK